MSTKEKKIGFVGLGRMGANMARNLKDKGYQVSSVFDINQEIASSLSNELGSHHAQSLADVTTQSDIILTVVTNDAAMDAIFLARATTYSEDLPANSSSIVPLSPPRFM